MNKVSRAIGTYVAVRVGGKCHALIGKAPPRASIRFSIGRQPAVSTLAAEKCQPACLGLLTVSCHRLQLSRFTVLARLDFIKHVLCFAHHTIMR